MIDLSKVRNYYIACGYTDLRLGIDGLAAVVTQQYSGQLDEESLFLFCGRRTDRIKALPCLREIVVSGVAVGMEIPLKPCQEFFGMLPAPPRVVFVQHNGLVCITAGSVQPHIAVALRLPSRLMEHLQDRLILHGGFLV